MTEKSQVTERCFKSQNKTRLIGYVCSSCYDVWLRCITYLKNRTMGTDQTLNVSLFAGPMPPSDNCELSLSDYVHITVECQHLLFSREEWELVLSKRSSEKLIKSTKDRVAHASDIYDLWYDMIRYDTWYMIWYNTWYDTIWYVTIRYDTIHDMIRYMIWYYMIYMIYDMIRHDMTWHDTTLHDAIRYDTIR